jgi:hypothetical protein
MRVFELRGLAPDASAIASEAFSRSWHFIERDPVLAGHDREALQAELALRIQQIMAADAAERDLRWPRLSEQFFRIDKWSICRG